LYFKRVAVFEPHAPIASNPITIWFVSGYLKAECFFLKKLNFGLLKLLFAPTILPIATLLEPVVFSA
jgi:hypothetical protein